MNSKFRFSRTKAPHRKTTYTGSCAICGNNRVVTFIPRGYKIEWAPVCKSCEQLIENSREKYKALTVHPKQLKLL